MKKYFSFIFNNFLITFLIFYSINGNFKIFLFMKRD